MVISKTEIQANILINNEKIEQVTSFTYLGADLNQQNDHSTEIRRRLAMARTSTTKLWKIWKDRSVNIKTKPRLLKSLIWPIALYGCETWTLKAADEKKLTAFELWTYRRILRISYFDKKTNEHVCS